MSRVVHGAKAGAATRLSANERLKRGWNARLGVGMLAAVALHAGVLAFWPTMQVSFERQTLQSETPRMLALQSAPEVRLPEAPDLGKVFKPVPPSLEELALDLAMDAEVPLPVLEDPALREAMVPVLNSPMDVEWVDYERFAPLLVRPEIRNRNEVQRYLQRHYTPILEFSGATGVVQVQFWIDERGAVHKAELATSSGRRVLDRLAMRLTSVLRFSPALRLGQPVRVQVVLPITFRAET